MPRPFTRRRYSLLAVTAAVLSDTARPQISLRDLAARIQAVTAAAGGITEFTARRDDRIALVDAVSLLADLGVLAVVETRGDYASDQEANALYDIDDRRLGHLISAPFPPSLATSFDHLMHEGRYGPWRTRGTTEPAPVAVTQPAVGAGAGHHRDAREQADPRTGTEGAVTREEQLRRRARHQIMRILLDDPVLYLDRLDPAERTYLQQTIGSIANWAAEAGMVLERRSEGWALIDPDNIATDLRFPEGNDQVKFAALLLLSSLQPQTVPAGTVRLPRQAAERVIAARLRANPAWARAYQAAPDGPAQLAGAALSLLADLDLALADRAGFTLLPASGRYRPEVSDITPPAVIDSEPAPGAPPGGPGTAQVPGTGPSDQEHCP